MTDDDDIDGLASEYVLGTLAVDERAAVAERRLREPSLDAAISLWEQRLAPLTELVREVEPPANLFAKIRSLIEDETTIVALHRRVRVWRTSAVLAGAIAASLLLALGVKEFSPPPKQQNLVAILQKDAASPAFLITVNIQDRIMTVQPVATKPAAGKSYELWLIQDSLGAPKSLGVIDRREGGVRPTLTAYKREVIESATLAVSLEPEGGSPTGAPTGPVVFSGKLIPMGE